MWGSWVASQRGARKARKHHGADVGLQLETWIVGEVHCLNCGAVLAEVVRGDQADRLLLRPARHQPEIQVEIVGARCLRCRRCGGRALADLLDDPIESVQAETRGTRYGPNFEAVPRRTAIAPEAGARSLPERLPLATGCEPPVRRGD